MTILWLTLCVATWVLGYVNGWNQRDRRYIPDPSDAWKTQALIWHKEVVILNHTVYRMAKKIRKLKNYVHNIKAGPEGPKKSV